MNFNRIQSLLRYDWTLQKRSISLALIITLALYVIMVLLFFLFKATFNFDAQGFEGLPLASVMFCNSFFSYAQIAMVLVVTQILHAKFTSPRTSLSYLTLPGTNAEKWLVMLLDYAIVAFALLVLQVVMYEVTSLVGYLMSPNLSWSFNPFAYTMFQNELFESIRQEQLATGDVVANEMMTQMLDKIMIPAMSMALFGNLLQLGIYIVLNMCFRTHGQLKSIACLMGFGAVMGIVFMVMAFNFIASVVTLNGDITPDFILNWIAGDGFSMANCLKWYYYSTPLLSAAVLYLFYKQICWKQAK